MKQAARQTRTHIGELLARHGINPRHDLGQNFLIDLNLVEYLVAQAELDRDDAVLEVGSGTGGLTAFLAEQAGAVIAVEVDPRMQQLTAEAVERFSNVTIVRSDVLKNKNRFAKPVLEALDAALLDRSKRLKLVANLPYCVATPVVSNLVAGEYDWERMVVTIQLELAERMTAKEDTSNYGALSVWLAAQCRIEILKRLSAEVFWPRPKIESAMIRIFPDAGRRQLIRDRGFLHEFLRKVFQQRRKLLRNVLVSQYKGELDRPSIGAILESQQLGERTRAEDLAPSVLVGLANALFETIQQTRGAERSIRTDH
jgi:16S rRNA (adenine1518-N6/adenine1519-N6)-dimethyltransferase